MPSCFMCISKSLQLYAFAGSWSSNSWFVHFEQWVSKNHALFLIFPNTFKMSHKLIFFFFSSQFTRQLMLPCLANLIYWILLLTDFSGSHSTIDSFSNNKTCSCAGSFFFFFFRLEWYITTIIVPNLLPEHNLFIRKMFSSINSIINWCL